MNISVIGTGSFGTSLALVLNDNAHQVLMYGRDVSIVNEINSKHTNYKYLKEIELSEKIKATTDLKEAVNHAELILLSVPVKAIRSVSQSINTLLKNLNKEVIIVHVAKGLELNTYLRVSEVINEEILSKHIRALAVLSGPSHAEEVALRQPTTVSVASQSSLVSDVQDVFMNDYFRVYRNNDMVGVEIGGALKNIIALGVGLLDGLGFGDNAKAATITRGLQEITRLGTKMGADPLTFSGLAGVGDLIVTATSQHSRNYRCGQMLASGMTLKEAEEKMGMVVEGINTTRAAYELSLRFDVDMPISSVLYHYLFNNLSKEEAFQLLMKREKTGETDELIEIMMNNRK